MPSGDYIGVADEGRADQKPRQNARHEHFRKGDVHHQAIQDHGDGRGNDDSQGTGNGREKDAGQYPRNGQPPREPPHQGVHEIDEAPGDGPLGHDGTGHDKKGNGQEDKLIQRIKELLGQDLQGGIGKEKKRDRGGNPQDYRNGYTGQEQKAKAETDGEGHDGIL